MSTPLALALDTCCLSILPSTTQTEDTCRRRVRRDTRPLKLVRVKVQAVYPPAVLQTGSAIRSVAPPLSSEIHVRSQQSIHFDSLCPCSRPTARIGP